MTTIVAAALLLEGDYVLTKLGARHPSLLLMAERFGGASLQGFLTSENTFVDRREAKRIAAEANQIPWEIVSNGLEELYTEDLW